METVEELKAWKCPDCGGRGATFNSDLAEQMTVPTDPSDGSTSFLLAHGMDPGFPKTRIKPIAYDQTIECENGHVHDAGKRFVT